MTDKTIQMADVIAENNFLREAMAKISALHPLSGLLASQRIARDALARTPAATTKGNDNG